MTISRVQYRERQRLTAADLRFEQSYRLGMAGRHYLGPHEWGVIRGLLVIRLEGGFRLLPGVAIDGYGRELLVPEAVDLSMPRFDDNLCRFVCLYYCDDPEQVLPGRACKDTPAPRIRQRVALRVTDTMVFSPDLPSDLLAARAAGSVPNSEAWPVLVARIGKGCPPPAKESDPLIDYSLVRYARHRAARVRAPTGHALLQLGLNSQTDVYHFLVSTSDSTNTLNKRLGIDRDRSLHVWKPLFISGAQANGEVKLGSGLKMQISMPVPAGLGRTLRIEGSFDRRLRTVSASLFDIGHATRNVGPLRIQDRPLAGNMVLLPFSGFHVASVSLLNSDPASPPIVGRVRKRSRELTMRGVAAHGSAVDAQTADSMSFSVPLVPTGGRLSLVSADPAEDVAAIPCDDVPRTRALAASSTGMMLLRPAAQIESDPLLRELHAVVTSAASDVVPKTELRISGGGADETDASPRLSVGALAGDDYLLALRMDGGKRFRLLAGPKVTDPQRLLFVERTVYLPPIGKSDPMLADLMALAYVSGLFQIGKVSADFKIELAANTTDGGTYDITVKPPSSPPFKAKRTLELIIGKDGPADVSVRALVEIPPGSTSVSANTRVTVPGLAPPGRAVSILILMLVESGNATRVAYSAKPLTLTIP